VAKGPGRNAAPSKRGPQEFLSRSFTFAHFISGQGGLQKTFFPGACRPKKIFIFCPQHWGIKGGADRGRGRMGNPTWLTVPSKTPFSRASLNLWGTKMVWGFWGLGRCRAGVLTGGRKTTGRRGDPSFIPYGPGAGGATVLTLKFTALQVQFFFILSPAGPGRTPLAGLPVVGRQKQARGFSISGLNTWGEHPWAGRRVHYTGKNKKNLGPKTFGAFRLQRRGFPSTQGLGPGGAWEKNL